MISKKDFSLVHNIEALRTLVYNYTGSMIGEELYKDLCVRYTLNIYAAGFELKRFPKI